MTPMKHFYLAVFLATLMVGLAVSCSPQNFVPVARDTEPFVRVVKATNIDGHRIIAFESLTTHMCYVAGWNIGIVEVPAAECAPAK
jgi:hypothetical protein